MSLTRRHVLRGLGASVALPFLPSLARAGTSPPVRRVLFWYLPLGNVPGHVVAPGGTRTSWSFGPAAAPLTRHRDRLTAVTGLETVFPYVVPDVDPHAILCASTLTGDFVGAGRADGPHGGRSADQLLADHLGTGTRFRSLEIASEGSFPCLPNLRCASLEHISWNGVDAPRTRETSPARLFERLFGNTDTAGDAVAAAERLARRQSVLDFVRGAAALTRRQLGLEDRARFDDWLDGVRDVEQRLGDDATGSAACLDGADLGRFAPGALTHAENIDRMHELMVLALRCDQTRVITYMIANEASQRVYRELGYSDTHHWLTHHGGLPWKVEACEVITRWQLDRLASLLDLLAATDDGAGAPLLDSTTVVAMGGMGDPELHIHWDIAALVAGDRYQTGRLAAFYEQPHADLLITIMQDQGIDIEAFGTRGDRRLSI